MRCDGFVEVFNTLGVGHMSIIQHSVNSLVEFSDGERSTRFLMITPYVQDLPDPKVRRGQIIHTPSVRGGVCESGGEPSTVTRLCLPILVNSGIRELSAVNPQDVSERMAIEALENGRWGLLLWEHILATALTVPAAKAIAEGLVPDRVASSFNKAVIEEVMRLEPVRNDMQYYVHTAAIRMGYPGRNIGQGYNPQVSEEVRSVIKERFWAVAQKMGYSLTCTPKSHPGSKLLHNTVLDTVQRKLGVWPKLAVARRSNRELWSGLINAQPLTNPVLPRVVDPGKPFEGFVTALNTCVAAPEYLSDQDCCADQMLLTDFGVQGGLLDAEVTRIAEVEAIGQTEEDVLLPFPQGSTATLIERPLAAGLEKLWLVEYPVKYRTDEVLKLSTPDGVKGMCSRTRSKFVERRPGEDFFRPIHLFIDPQTVVAKEARRMVLRMHASRIPDYVPDPDATFEEVTQSLRGTDPTSEVFLVEDGTSEIEVLGVGKLKCSLTPVGRFRTGEVVVMRMPEGEHHGHLLHHVALDAFMVMGRDDIDARPPDENIQYVDDLVGILKGLFSLVHDDESIIEDAESVVVD